MVSAKLPIELKSTEVRPGDVILCYSQDMREERPGRQSGYSHAAICFDDGKILESAGSGVRKTDIKSLLDEYGHLAVIRNFDAWGELQLHMLKEFATRVVGTPFNSPGLKNYEAQRMQSLTTQLERISVSDRVNAIVPFKPATKLFCSELVVTAFIEVGLIGALARQVFEPEIFLPQDIADDMLFGFFIGYILPYQSYVLPEDDYFRAFAEDEHFLNEARLSAKR